MKKKNIKLLKLKKHKVSNLNSLHNRFGGNNSGETTGTLTDTESVTNPTVPIYTENCPETETCYTVCGGCNTNDTTRGQQPPSVQVACHAIGSIVGC